MWKLVLASAAVAGLALAGCSEPDPFAGTGSPRYTKPGPIPKGGGRRQIGKPYQVAGRWFYPKADPHYHRVGKASWYGPKFDRRMTANGEWFDMNYRSAAHPTLPLPSYAKVTNLENGRSVVVRINDRGPFVGDRIIDLSRKSAQILGFENQGTAKVDVRYIGPAPLNDTGHHLAAMNRNYGKGQPVPARLAHGSSPQEYFVQVAAYRNPDNAARARDRLSRLGPVRVTPVNGSYGTIYRVRLGPMDSESAAHAALGQVVRAGHADARVVNAGL